MMQKSLYEGAFLSKWRKKYSHMARMGRQLINADKEDKKVIVILNL